MKRYRVRMYTPDDVVVCDVVVEAEELLDATAPEGVRLVVEGPQDPTLHAARKLYPKLRADWEEVT